MNFTRVFGQVHIFQSKRPSPKSTENRGLREGAETFRVCLQECKKLLEQKGAKPGENPFNPAYLTTEESREEKFGRWAKSCLTLARLYCFRLCLATLF